MGNAARRNEQSEEHRKIARKIRDEAQQAFAQAFAVLSNAMAVSVVITEHSGTFNEKGAPMAQTQSFTVCHSVPEVGLEHLSAGAELLHKSHERAAADLMAHRDKQRQDEAAALPTPEGMEE